MSNFGDTFVKMKDNSSVKAGIVRLTVLIVARQ